MSEENTKQEDNKGQEVKEEEKKDKVASEVSSELIEKYGDFVSKIEGMTVIELSELVKVLEEKFGVSAAVMAVADGGPGGEGAVEEKDSFNVVLKGVGDSKINAIKAVKEITGLGLKEAKGIVDGAPKVVKEGVTKDEAEEMKKKLEEAGVVVELE